MVTINPELTALELKYAINKVSVKLIACQSEIGNLQHYRVLHEMIPDLTWQNKFNLKASNVESLNNIILFDDSRPGTIGWSELTQAAQSADYARLEQTNIRYINLLSIHIYGLSYSRSLVCTSSQN